MKTEKNYTIQKENIDNMVKNKRFNRALELTIKGHTYTIGAGYSDTVKVFSENDYIYVLTLNYNLEYIGLECFKDNEKINDIFLQNDYDIEALLGKKAFDYSAIYICKVLSNYID